MPRPPILATVDWKTVFDAGLTYDKWIELAENKDHAQAMDDARKSQFLEKHVMGMLGALDRPVHVIAIAEDWCGDVVRHVPVLEALADAAPHIHTRYIARNQFPEVFVRFLTNGGEAIPKFIFLGNTFTECGNWGPMPDNCREVIARGKAASDVAAARQRVTALYAADDIKRNVVNELLHLIDIASTETP